MQVTLELQCLGRYVRLALAHAERVTDFLTCSKPQETGKGAKRHLTAICEEEKAKQRCGRSDVAAKSEATRVAADKESTGPKQGEQVSKPKQGANVLHRWSAGQVRKGREGHPIAGGTQTMSQEELPSLWEGPPSEVKKMDMTIKYFSYESKRTHA